MHKSNIVLKSISIHDSETIFKWRSNKLIWKNFIPPKPISKIDHKVWMDTNINNIEKKVFIARYENNQIGLIKFYNFNVKEGLSFWSFYLKPGLKGKVLGALLEWRVLDFFFLDQNMKILFCNVLKENIAVTRLHKRFGFQDDERAEKVIEYHKKTYQLENLYLKRDSWLKNREKVVNQINKVMERSLFSYI